MAYDTGPPISPASVTGLEALNTLLLPSVTIAQYRDAHTRDRAVFTACTIAMLLPLGYIATRDWPNSLRVLLLIGWALLFLFVPGRKAFPLLSGEHNADSALDERLIHALDTVADPAAIGILIEAEAASAGERRAAIQAALTRLLPRAAEIDFSYRFATEIDRLYTHIDAIGKLASYSGNKASFTPYPLGGTWERAKIVSEDFPELTDQYEEFLLAILACLAAAGDAEAISHLEALAASKAPTEQLERINKAARVSLDALHSRLEAQARTGVLMRPSDMPVDRLPRPSRSPAHTAPESLLRPDPADEHAAETKPGHTE
jgi:hypothetical protein